MIRSVLFVVAVEYFLSVVSVVVAAVDVVLLVVVVSRHC